MRDYVLDANAVLRYFGVGKALGGEKVAELFLAARDGSARLFISAINLGEIFYVLLKHVGDSTAREYLRALQNTVAIVDIDSTSALQAASFKHQYRIGYADSFAAVLALRAKATLVSADPAFEKFGKRLKWLRLPPFQPALSPKHKSP